MCIVWNLAPDNDDATFRIKGYPNNVERAFISNLGELLDFSVSQTMPRTGD